MTPGRAAPLWRRRIPREGGFTLIEVLVSLTLLAIVFAMVFGALRFTGRARAITEVHAVRAERIQTAHRLLRRLLARAYPLAWKAADGPRYAFEGRPKTLTFVTLLPGYPSIAGPYTVTLYADKSRDGEALWLKLAPYRRDPDKGPEPETIEDVILMPAPVEVAFTYFGKPDDQADARWFSEWGAEDRLPSMVRIALGESGSKSAGRPIPDMVLPIGIDMDVGCLFEKQDDPVLCRLDAEIADAARKAGPEQGTAAKKTTPDTTPKTAPDGASGSGNDAGQPKQ